MARLRPLLVRARRHGHLLAVVAALVVALAPFGEALLPDRVLTAGDQLLFTVPFDRERPAEVGRASNLFLADATDVFEPERLEVRRALLDGRLPLWNPYAGAGHPLLADQQSAPLAPTTLLTLLAPADRAGAIVVWAKLLLAAAGTVLLLRRLGAGPLGAAFGAIAFPLGTYTVIWLEHPHAGVYALLPGLLWLGDRLAARRRVADGLALGAGLGLAALSGHPPSVVLAVLATGLWTVLRAAGRGGLGRRERAAAGVRALGLLALATVAGGAVGAVMAVPFAEMLGQSVDPGRGRSPIRLGALQTFLAPESWGRPDKAIRPGAPGGFAEVTGYVGIATLALAAGALAALRRSAVWHLAVLGLAAAVITYTVPVTADLAREVPGLADLDLKRALVVLTLALAVLGALGLDALVRGHRRDRRAVALGASLVAALPLAWLAVHAGSLDLAAALRHLPVEDRLPGATVEALDEAGMLRALALALATATVAWAVATRWSRLAVPAGVALVALLALDVGSLARGYHPIVPRAEGVPPRTAVLDALGAAGSERVTAEGDALRTNTATRFALRDARVHQLPPLERYVETWAAAGGVRTEDDLRATAYPTASVPSLDAIFGIRRRLTNGRPAGPGTRTGWAAVPGGEGLVLARGDLPGRAWLASSWRQRPTLDAVLAEVRGTAVAADLVRTPIVEGGPPPATGPLVPHPGPRPVRFVRDEAHEVVLEAEADRRSLLVLADTHYPGWKAWVDGEETPIHAVNGATRGVVVPRGRHEVRFAYEPASARWGLLVTVLSLAALAFAGGWRLRARRRRRGQARPADPMAASTTSASRSATPG